MHLTVLCGQFRSLAWAICVAAVLLSGGCGTPYRHPQLAPPANDFPGMAQAYEAADGSRVPEVDVLLVHGMGYHDATWIQTIAQPLSAALGFSPGAASSSATIANGAELYTETFQDSARTLRVIAVLWSPITSEAKQRLCYDVNEKTALCTNPGAFTPYKRAWANGYIKSQIMDSALADVTFYLGEEGGPLIRDAVDDALLRSMSVERFTLDQLRTGSVPHANSTPLFVISESLGSKITVDSLDDLEVKKHAPDFARDLRSHIHALFLLANQIPILNMGTRDAEGHPDVYGHLKAFVNARRQRRDEQGLSRLPLHIVAFSDPSDIFSYVLTDNAAGTDAIVSNVIVSNDCTYLGIIENPANAHEKYIENSPVATAIALGSTTLSKAKGVRCAR
ncbi:MAG TPA: hypothetical protein VK437_10650 [Steroidobacteraceae bacterium]|nr:hypothetical protein [Steroidobacteraceae bacterium]